MKFLFLTFLILLPFSSIVAQRTLTIKEISRTSDHVEEGEACIEIISNDAIIPRSVMEDFESTRLSDGRYSYKTIVDLELGKRRKIYIAAPLVIEQEYTISNLKSNEYIRLEASLSRNELEITEVNNLAPSKNSNAIYRFYTNLADVDIRTNEGLKFENTGKNESSYFVYELAVPVSGTETLTATIDAAGYEKINYELTDVSQRIYGFFIFPKEECFNKNIELGGEYFREGLYDDALLYYSRASECKDIDPDVAVNTRIKQVENCKKIKDRILYLDKRANTLVKDGVNDNIDSEVDSVYWYKSGAIDGMNLLRKYNPADEFCSDNATKSRTEELLNSSRMIGGIVTDLEYTNQVLANVIIYGADNSNTKPKDMVRLGESNAEGKFRIKVPNSYKVLYFEHGLNKDYNKPIRVDITNGRQYKYHVKLQRKVMRIKF